jgi:hypothetical protein
MSFTPDVESQFIPGFNLDLVRYIKVTRTGFQFTEMNSGFPNVGVGDPTQLSRMQSRTGDCSCKAVLLQIDGRTCRARNAKPSCLTSLSKVK